MPVVTGSNRPAALSEHLEVRDPVVQTRWRSCIAP